MNDVWSVPANALFNPYKRSQRVSGFRMKVDVGYFGRNIWQIEPITTLCVIVGSHQADIFPSVSEQVTQVYHKTFCTT